MSNRAKREYLEAVYSRYHAGSRSDKQQILDEMCRVCNYHRKYAIRLLAQPPPSARVPAMGQRPGRPPVYDSPEIASFLKALWKASNLACGKRLHAMIPFWLPSYARHHRISSDAQALLGSISAATIDRLLSHWHGMERKVGLSLTRPGSLLRQQVPIRTNQWDETRAGFVEVDSVAHCGASTAGMFVLTIDMVDIATTWNEQRAVWGKGERNVFSALQDMEAVLPFRLRGFDADNGGEFLNHHLHKHYTGRKPPVQFTRSRPYHKNDNAHIEQKNWTTVRQYLGYERFDDPKLVPMLNDLYTTEWRLLHNLFIPSTKLISKERVGSRIIKHYDTPKTPLERCLDAPDVSRAEKRRLRALRDSLNPFTLQKQVANKIKAIFQYLATVSTA